MKMKKFTGVCVSVIVLTIAALLLFFFPSGKEGQKEAPANKTSSVNPEWYKTDRDYQRERKDKIN